MTSQVSQTDRRELENKLNDLPGKEWIQFTKSWFILNPAPRKAKMLHPASFPEELAEEFIQFFTKENQWVIDPFAGTASTLVAAKNLNRNSVGIELYSDYVSWAEKRLKSLDNSGPATVMIQADSRHLKDELLKRGLQKMDFCITSPPYWNQLKRSSERQKIRHISGMRTIYGDCEKDLSAIEDYGEFLSQLEIVFDNVYDIMSYGSYLVVVTNNIYAEGRIWPLAFDTFNMLSKRWTPKDERIWCQNDKKLFPFGMFHSYVGNRSHHYCLVFKK